jgi:hypothetical protein
MTTPDNGKPKHYSRLVQLRKNSERKARSMGLPLIGLPGDDVLSEFKKINVIFSKLKEIELNVKELAYSESGENPCDFNADAYETPDFPACLPPEPGGICSRNLIDPYQLTQPGYSDCKEIWDDYFRKLFCCFKKWAEVVCPGLMQLERVLLAQSRCHLQRMNDPNSIFYCPPNPPDSECNDARREIEQQIEWMIQKLKNQEEGCFSLEMLADLEECIQNGDLLTIETGGTIPPGSDTMSIKRR